MDVHHERSRVLQETNFDQDTKKRDAESQSKQEQRAMLDRLTQNSSTSTITFLMDAQDNCQQHGASKNFLLVQSFVCNKKRVTREEYNQRSQSEPCFSQSAPRKSRVSGTFPLKFRSFFVCLTVDRMTVKIRSFPRARIPYRQFYRQSAPLGADR